MEEKIKTTPIPPFRGPSPVKTSMPGPPNIPKYRVVEYSEGFYIEKLEKVIKPKTFAGIVYGKRIGYEYKIANFHLERAGGRLYGWMLRNENSAFKTLDEAKTKAAELIKYEVPIIHHL